MTDRVYRHTKTGKLYLLRFWNARIESEGMGGEKQVVYVSKETGQVWVRPHSEFFGQIRHPFTSQLLPRFAEVDADAKPHPWGWGPPENGTESRWRGQDRRRG